jgi:glycerol kinase
VRKNEWDAELLALLDVPVELMPRVLPSSGHFGDTRPSLLGGAIMIGGVAGDQQSALFGQACFAPGMAKNTYGTGCFMLMNTGAAPVASRNKLLTTVGWQGPAGKDRTAYCLEGSVFMAGATVQWLRDGLQIIQAAPEVESLAAQVDDTGDVYLVPAFTGLGAPYWDPTARGAILGLTRDTGIAEIVRSALEAVCYQTRDLMTAMAADAGSVASKLRVDGGMVRNDWVMQFLADLLNVPVERPVVTETTALGAATCAGLGTGLYASLEEVAGNWQRDRVFAPTMKDDQREQLYAGWRAAVKRVQSAAAG